MTGLLYMGFKNRYIRAIRYSYIEGKAMFKQTCNPRICPRLCACFGVMSQQTAHNRLFLTVFTDTEQFWICMLSFFPYHMKRKSLISLGLKPCPVAQQATTQNLQNMALRATIFMSKFSIHLFMIHQGLSSINRLATQIMSVTGKPFKLCMFGSCPISI